MDIEAAFEADIAVSMVTEIKSSLRLDVSKLQTRIECKLARNGTEEKTIHIRQTGHVTLDADLMPALEEEAEEITTLSLQQVKDIITPLIIVALKKVDCDLPPLVDICENTQVRRS